MGGREGEELSQASGLESGDLILVWGGRSCDDREWEVQPRSLSTMGTALEVWDEVLTVAYEEPTVEPPLGAKGYSGFSLHTALRSSSKDIRPSSKHIALSRSHSRCATSTSLFDDAFDPLRDAVSSSSLDSLS